MFREVLKVEIKMPEGTGQVLKKRGWKVLPSGDVTKDVKGFDPYIMRVTYQAKDSLLVALPHPDRLAKGDDYFPAVSAGSDWLSKVYVLANWAAVKKLGGPNPQPIALHVRTNEEYKKVMEFLKPVTRLGYFPIWDYRCEMVTSHEPKGFLLKIGEGHRLK